MLSKEWKIDFYIKVGYFDVKIWKVKTAKKGAVGKIDTELEPLTTNAPPEPQIAEQLPQKEPEKESQIFVGGQEGTLYLSFGFF